MVLKEDYLNSISPMLIVPNFKTCTLLIVILLFFIYAGCYPYKICG